MEEEKQGCHEDECIDTPSVTARLSAVSLKDDPKQQAQQSTYSMSPSLAAASHANALADTAHATRLTDVGSSHAPCMNVSDVTFADLSPAMCVDVSLAACVDGPHEMQQEAVAKQGLDVVNRPCWAEMVPDALIKIFNCLPPENILCTIPCVCRAWRFVSQASPCWQKVDLSEWIKGKQPKTLERMLLLVVNRSQGCLQEICVPTLRNDTMLRLIADSGSQLQVLRIPDSFVSEECLCELAPKFASLMYLDISGRFPSRALIESFGKHCPFITRLNLNMGWNASISQSCDIAAFSVAEYMPQMKHLDMAYGLLSNMGLKAILENCTSLEHLNLRGCWHVNREEFTRLNAGRRIQVFLSGVVENDIYDFSDDDDGDEDPLEYDECTYDDLEYYDDFMDDNVEFFDEFDLENMDEDDDFLETYMHAEDI